jgi:nitrogen fixation/metabolism regulation signal transduction histidine kinase
MSFQSDVTLRRLRERAEAILSNTKREDEAHLTPDEMRTLIHDFAVHQVELEIQNEELLGAERELKDARDSYARLYNQSPVGYLTLDENGVIKRANQTFVALAGKPLSSLIGTPLSHFLEQPDRNIFWGSYRTFFKSPDGKQLDLRMNFTDTPCFWARLTGRIEPDLTGGGRGDVDATELLVIVNNITEQMRAEEALKDKITELERFSYTVSHDLKSPLITIQSYAVMVIMDLEAGNYERALRDLEKIKGASVQMAVMIDDLLELSRIGKVMSPPAPTDMNLLVADVLKQLAGPLTGSKVEIFVQPDLPTVNADRQRISEVLQNLIENAIKYMGDQSAPRIEVGATVNGAKGVFFVSDNGKGIDCRHHDTIFGLFNRLDAESGGAGVGLALVKRVIEAHGGIVWVESDGLGSGSRFSFTLPLQ